MISDGDLGKAIAAVIAREESAALLAGGVIADAPCRRGQHQRVALARWPKVEV